MAPKPDEKRFLAFMALWLVAPVADYACSFTAYAFQM
jgi:hypothetical protein